APQGQSCFHAADLARQFAPPHGLLRHALGRPADLPRHPLRRHGEPDLARLPADRLLQRSRREHRPRPAGHLLGPPAPPREEGPPPPRRDLLAPRVEADDARPEDPRRPHGTRLRPRDVDDAPPGAAPGGRLQEDPARRLRRILRPRRPRLDHQGAQPRRPRGRPPPGHGGEGREALPRLHGRLGHVPGAGPGMGRQLLERMNDHRSRSWRWGVCVLLLLATTINYMDRLTLSTAASRIMGELRLTNGQYGNLEFSFGLAFAAGSLLFGYLSDR